MTDPVITSKDIQNKYQKLYQFMMEFLWDYKVVETLANLEISCYKIFPDKEEMLKYIEDLRRNVEATYSELSEDDKPQFQEIFDSLSNMITAYSPDTAGAELYSVSEPVELPRASTEDKKVFKVGDIQVTHKSENDEVEENDEVIEEEPDRLSNPFEEE